MDQQTAHSAGQITRWWPAVPWRALARLLGWSIALLGTWRLTEAYDGRAGVAANLAWFATMIAFVRFSSERRHVLFVSVTAILFTASTPEATAAGIMRLAVAALLSFAYAVYVANRSLRERLRASGRSFRSIVLMSFKRWVLLTFVVAATIFFLVWSTQAAERGFFLYSTFDAWCDVPELSSPRLIPCTDLKALPPDRIVEFDKESNLKYRVYEHFREARQRIVTMPENELLAGGRDPQTLRRWVDPVAILGLPDAIEADSEVIALRLALNRHNARPVPRSELPGGGSHEVDRPSRTNPDWVAYRDRQRELARRLADRRALLRNQLLTNLSEEDQKIALQRDALSLGLATTARLAAHRALVVPEASATDAENVLRQSLVRALADGEAASLAALLATRGADWEIMEEELVVVKRCKLANLDQKDGNNFGAFPCFYTGDRTSALPLIPRSFRESVHLSIDRWHREKAFAVSEDLAKRDAQTHAGEQSARDAVKGIADLVPTEVPIEAAGGGNFIKRWFKNQVIRAIKQAYRTARSIAWKRTKEATDRRIFVAGKNAREQIDYVRTTMDRELAELASEAHATADYLFAIGSLFQIIGWLTLLVVILKSFFHVMALEVFYSEEIQPISFGFDTMQEIEGRINKAQSVTIDRAFLPVIRTVKQMANTQETKSFAPWPTWAIVSRLLHFRYLVFNAGEFIGLRDPKRPEKGPAGMIATARPGLAIVEWQMAEGEEVIFDVRHFYGASENVEIRTEISLQLATLLLGRIRFHIARCALGEGRLLLEAAVVDSENEEVHSIPVNQLVAWNRHTKFTAHSHRRPFRTLINNFTLVRSAAISGTQGLWVTAPPGHDGTKWGILRFGKRIFRSVN